MWCGRPKRYNPTITCKSATNWLNYCAEIGKLNLHKSDKFTWFTCVSILPILTMFRTTAQQNIQNEYYRTKYRANGNSYVKWWEITVQWFIVKWIIQIFTALFNRSHVMVSARVQYAIKTFGCKLKNK